MRFRVLAGAVGLVAVSLVACRAGTAAERLTAFPENHSTLTVLLDGESYLEIALMGWEPGWKYMGIDGKIVEEGEATLLANYGENGQRRGTLGRSSCPEKRPAATDSPAPTLRTSQDTELLYLHCGPQHGRRSVSRRQADRRPWRREEGSVASPRSEGRRRCRRGYGSRRLAGSHHSRRFSRPCNIPTDGPARIILARRRVQGRRAFEAD